MTLIQFVWNSFFFGLIHYGHHFYGNCCHVSKSPDKKCTIHIRYVSYSLWISCREDEGDCDTEDEYQGDLKFQINNCPESLGFDYDIVIKQILEIRFFVQL